MTAKLDIYFIRHSKPLIEAGTCYGHLDCPVADDYEHQLAKIISYFEGIKINAIYSSPLIRCSVLAEDIAKEYVDEAIVYDNRLKEIHFGDWEGKKWNDIAREKIDEWNENRLSFCFPNGESPEIFHERVLQVSNEFFEFDTSNIILKSIVVVAHSGVICSLLCRHHGIPLEDMTELNVDYASISKISLCDNDLNIYNSE